MLSAVQRSLSFLNVTEPESSSSGGTTQCESLPIEELAARLNLWVHQGAPQEKRVEAKKRMLDAYESQAPTLRLSALALRDIPSEIGLFERLESLCLWGNQLSTLPVEIWQLTRLIKLNLGRNLFRELPSLIENLQVLQELNLRGNPIQHMPAELRKLAHLKSLHPSMLHAVSRWPHSRSSLHAEGLGTLQDKELTLPNLPSHLASIHECQQFFNAFSHQLNGHYFALQTLTSSSLLEPEPSWTQTISSTLNVVSMLSSVVTGEVVLSLAQQRARNEASEQALAVLGLFPTHLHFMATVRHAGVLFTERLSSNLQQVGTSRTSTPSEPPIKGYARTLTRAYTTLQNKAGFQVAQPWEKVRSAREMSTLFLKNLIDNPEVQRFAANNNLDVASYARCLAEIVVNDVLGQHSMAHGQTTAPLSRSYSDLGRLDAVGLALPQQTLPHAADFKTQLQDVIAKALEPLQQQVDQLRAEVAQLKQDNEVLRQARLKE